MAAATAPPKPITIYERCRIAPPTDNGATVQSLPLVFFDMVWLHFSPIQRLLFYQFPCSQKHFLETIVPNIKKSLSLTLKHFLPLAGNLIYPLNNSALMPEFRYIPGDSVSVTIAESNVASEYFNYLTGNEPRDADQFYAFVPDLPQPRTEHESGIKIIPLFAVQITNFPDIGICLGFTNHHAIGDASSIVGFVKAWSSIAMQDGNVEFLADNHSVPFYDRFAMTCPIVFVIIYFLNLYINYIKKNVVIINCFTKTLTNKLRATYILTKNNIQKLRNFVQTKKPASITHLSSFTITTAYVWTCLVKSATDAGEEVDDDEPEHFVFAVDARRRLDPPVPATYFGNCVAFGITESTHGQLKGDDGFLLAVRLIGEVISKKVNNKDEILRDAEKWMSKFSSLNTKRAFGVAGSPKFDLYGTEFGWGKPDKFEVVSIDGTGSMSLCNSREFEGGLEIGLCLPNKKMEAFAAIFSAGLEK
ncbi:hypothetical protein DH2020_003729 [Rehmannia glutinosa]|uniref:Uncharacterized protein n=1 Tax=Rehmannia glutinosa TaxID=99300 RepID=A0ABR0XMU0_REHGL